MNIYIGNIDYSVREEQLEMLVSQYADIISCKIIRDKDTGESSGFGFVDTLDDQGGIAVISEVHGMKLAGRSLIVHQQGTNTDH